MTNYLVGKIGTWFCSPKKAPKGTINNEPTKELCGDA